MSNTSTLIRKRCIGGLLAYRVRNGSHEKLLILGLSAFFSLNCLGFMSQVLCGLLIAMAVLCHIESSKRKPNQELDLDGGCIYLFGGKRTGPPLLGAVRRNSAHRGVDDSVESVRYCALPALQRVIRAGVIAATGMQNKLPYGQLYAKPV